MGELVVTNSRRTLEEEKCCCKINGIELQILDGKFTIDSRDASPTGYKIDCFIGNGANAVVVHATEELTERKVALKYWLPNLAKGKSNITRSTEEIKKLSRFDHNSIVRMYHFNRVDIFTYCVMELVKGETIRTKLNRGGFTQSRRLDIVLEIIKGLEYSHSKNIYHGDLHLENVMITDQNDIKLLDFGTSIFSGKYSKMRDSKLIAESLIEITGLKYEKLIDLNGKLYGDYSPECVCLIMKAFAKISVLIEFGLGDNVMYDLALFCVMVPFFDISYIESLIQHKCAENARDTKPLDYFRTIALRELLLRVDIEKYKDKELNDQQVPELYKRWRYQFIDKISRGENIYRGDDDKELFNSELYMKGLDT